MRKFTFSFKSLLVACGLLAGSANAWATKTRTITLYPTGATDPTNTSLWSKHGDITATQNAGYISLSSKGNGQREAYLKFYTTGSDFYGTYASYSVEFDFYANDGWAYATGTSTPQVALYSEDATVGNNSQTFTGRNTSKKNYLMLWSNTAVSNSATTPHTRTEMALNGSDTYFNISNSTWYTAKISVDISTGQVTYSICPKGSTTPITNASGTYNATTDGSSYKCQGLYFSLGKSCKEVRIANVKVKTTEEVDLAAFIPSNKGDLTELINSDFESNATGWTGYTSYWALQDWSIRNWRGATQNAFIERNSNGTITTTLTDMPAGTYKVVAAARAYPGCKIAAQIAGTSGTEMTGVGDAAVEGRSEINTNGVEMPYSSLGGFTTNANGHNWKWISAQGALNSAGDLVINFNCTGSNWMAIDDIHLYYISDAYSGHSLTTQYCMSANNVETNKQINLNKNTRCVTCDITLTNPNVIIRTSEQIKTAAGQVLNNNKYSSTAITKLVLYDGYDYEDYTDGQSSLVYTNGATLYRSLAADTWSTLVVPFYPTNLDVMKVPSAYSEGTATFSDAPAKDVNNVPLLVKSTAGTNVITGERNSTYGTGYGTGTTTIGYLSMNGLYAGGYVPVSTDDNKYYVAGNDNKLHKVIAADAVGINPFRAYFTLSDASLVRGFIDVNFDDTVTGVETMGAIQVEVDEVLYNTAGQIVNKDYKGIVIKNGKKYLNK